VFLCETRWGSVPEIVNDMRAARPRACQKTPDPWPKTAHYTPTHHLNCPDAPTL